MLLASTSAKIEFVLGENHSTNNIPAYAAWFDSASSPTGSSAGATSNDTTQVTLVASPGASTIRQINEVTICNTDTINHNVKVRFNDGTNTFILIEALLPVNYSLCYSKQFGWTVNSPAGPVVNNAIAPNLYWKMHLANAQSLSTSTPVVAHMDTIDYDPQGWCDAVTNKGRVTPKVAGKYLINAVMGTSFTTGPSVGGELCRARVLLNGTEINLNVDVAQVASLSNFNAFCNVSTVIAVNGSTDYLESGTNTDGTGSPTLRGDPRFTFFTGVFIGP